MLDRKKQNEFDILNKAIEVGSKYGNEYTKKIIDFINCEDLNIASEHPDFIRINKKEKLLIGIEHFRIDHYVKPIKNERIKSTGILFKKETRKIYDTWKDEVRNSEKIPNGAIDEIISTVVNQLERSNEATYNNFISAFKYGLDLHSAKLDGYINTLNANNANNFDIKMCFLLEIYTDFRDLFYNHFNTSKKIKSGLMPFFQDVINLLKNVDENKLNYLILYLNEYNGTERKVYAFDAKNLIRELKYQNILICEYAGYDYILKTFENAYSNFKIEAEYEKNYEKTDINFRFDFDWNDLNNIIELKMTALKRAIELKKMGKAFICDEAIQRYMYIYEKNIVDWNLVKGKDNIYMPIIRNITPQIIDRRDKEFSDKFKIKEQNISE